MIIDDIKKDESVHQYDWLIQVPDDLVVKTNREGNIILGSADPRDNRRLLVQMITANGAGNWVLENYEVKRSPETGDTTSSGMGHRLKYSLRAVEPGFRVLLFPFRDGDALPAVSGKGPLGGTLGKPDRQIRFNHYCEREDCDSFTPRVACPRVNVTVVFWHRLCSFA